MPAVAVGAATYGDRRPVPVRLVVGDQAARSTRSQIVGHGPKHPGGLATGTNRSLAPEADRRAVEIVFPWLRLRSDRRQHQAVLRRQSRAGVSSNVRNRSLADPVPVCPEPTASEARSTFRPLTARLITVGRVVPPECQLAEVYSAYLPDITAVAVRIWSFARIVRQADAEGDRIPEPPEVLNRRRDRPDPGKPATRESPETDARRVRDHRVNPLRAGRRIGRRPSLNRHRNSNLAKSSVTNSRIISRGHRAIRALRLRHVIAQILAKRMATISSETTGWLIPPAGPLCRTTPDA